MRVKTVTGLVLLTLVCGAFPALAGERVRFSIPEQTDEEAAALIPALERDGTLAARVDLNGDARPEFIMKDGGQSCTPDKGCPYTVHARKNGEWIKIGAFEGFNILISDKTTYGIRDILVYTLPYNDFKSERYAWVPARYEYEKKADN